MLQLVSHHVIENQEIGFKTFGTELWRVVGLHQSLAGNVTHNYYMLGTATKLSMPFQVLVVVTLERNFLLRLRSNCN